jgi:hypothetical protein
MNEEREYNERMGNISKEDVEVDLLPYYVKPKSVCRVKVIIRSIEKGKFPPISGDDIMEF